MPQPTFSLTGQVRLESGQPAAGLLIRAFDRDLRREELLGEATTGQDGRYTISYTDDQFTRAEKKSADLLVRAYAPDGALLGESPVRFNAGAQEVVDLTVSAPEPPQLSRYEQLLAELAPVLDGVPLTELTDDDMAFLAGDTGLPAAEIALLRDTALLGREAALPPEALYAFAMRQLPRELDQLLAREPGELRAALEWAVSDAVAPASLSGQIDAILARLAELRYARGLIVTRRVVGRLLDAGSGKPLAALTVRALNLDAGAQPAELGADTSDAAGRFVIAYDQQRRLTPSDNPAGHKLRLAVLDSQGRELHRQDVEQPGEQQSVELRVTMPPPAPAPQAVELAAALNLSLPSALRDALAQQKVTLAQIGGPGGVARLTGRADLAEDSAARRLEAHAALSALSPDLRLNEALIDGGFTSPLRIASVPQTIFISQVRGALQQLDASPDLKAAQLHAAALAQVRYINGLLLGLLADAADGRPAPFLEVSQ